MRTIKLPYGISNFRDLINQGYHYVDKTDYLEVLENMSKKYFFYLRPRRFGKSLFISVLQYYYGLEHKDKFQQLFGHFYIGQQPTPLVNSYLVLNFEFTKINTHTFEETYQGFLQRVKSGAKRFFDTYPQFFTVADRKATLQLNNSADIMENLITLMLVKAPDYKMYVLIDEYDHFANELMAFRLEEFKDVVSKDGFVRKFYEAIKEGTHAGVVDRLFATGVTPITLDSLTSGFNIGTNLSTDMRVVNLMGFTDKMVRQLLEQAVPESPIQIEDLMTLLKEWYNGYKFNQHVKTPLYNPNMVLYFLEHFQNFGKLPEKMLDTNISSDYHKVKRLIHIETPSENLAILEKIISEQTIRGQLTEQFNFARRFTSYDFLSLLFYNGFLTISHNRANYLFFKIPNYVIQKLYFDYFFEMLQEKSKVSIKIDHIADAVFEMAFKGNPQPFFQLIENILHQLADRDYQKFDEKYVKLLMLSMMMLSDTYYVESERETPNGYIDLSFLSRPNIPVDHQFIFELKYLKKENAKKLAAAEKQAKKQLLDYITASDKLRDLKDLQAWTVVVIKDEVIGKRIQ